MATATYTEVASAAGAWTCPVLLPPTPFDQVRAVLTAVTTNSGWPISAFLYCAGGEAVTELLLYRDPSRTHGTPSVAACVVGAEALAGATGWALDPSMAPRTGVLVGLGLREGYEPGAPQHHPREVDALLSGIGTDWRCRSARLVSARLVDSTTRWYDELGVVVQAPVEMRPVVERIAAVFAQHRFVITDLAAEQTRALAQRREGLPAGGQDAVVGRA